MRSSLFAALGALNGLCAMAAGAFGAHTLRARLDPDHFAVFETAARYHMYHALALFAVAYLIDRGARGARAAGVLMLAGIVCFSGSLYALSLVSVRPLGVITPIGGLCFISAWVIMAWGAWKNRRVP